MVYYYINNIYKIKQKKDGPEPGIDGDLAQ